MIDQLTRTDFEGLADGALKIESGGEAIPLSVRELRDLPPASPRPHPFAVELAGPAAPHVPQGMHVLVHPRLGPLELFIVPIGRDAAVTRYEIIFN